MARRSLKRKSYDDRALALALAHPTKPIREIAREFGLCEGHVRHIRQGRKRPGLQRLIRSICQEADDQLVTKACEEMWAVLEAQIRTAMTGPRGLARRCREYLLNRFLPPEMAAYFFKHGTVRGWDASPTLQQPSGLRAPPGAGRRLSGRRLKFYDDESLVRDVAEGRVSLGQIARKHNLSRQLVCRIRQGKYRPDLTARIDELRQLLQVESNRQITTWIKPLLAEELRVGITGTNNTARICREYVLERFLPADSQGRYAPLGKNWQRRRRWRRNRNSSGSPPERV